MFQQKNKKGPDCSGPLVNLVAAIPCGMPPCYFFFFLAAAFLAGAFLAAFLVAFFIDSFSLTSKFTIFVRRPYCDPYIRLSEMNVKEKMNASTSVAAREKEGGGKKTFMGRIVL
ncbi:MAG: hypothetical protein JJE04_25285 [Acidobacteriia bacterium]|nr:hypothetical protein [Terriglobia bacterium]